MHIFDGMDIPVSYILIKIPCSIKHILHIVDILNIPVSYVLIEIRCPFKHIGHFYNIGYIPIIHGGISRNFCGISKHIACTRYR